MKTYEPDKRVIPVLLLASTFFTPVLSNAQTLLWARQFATPTTADAAFQIASDSSGVYIVGTTLTTALPGQTLIGTIDGYIRKYDPSGTVLWTREFGIPSQPFTANGVAVDATGVYVVGSTFSSTQRRASGSSGAVVMKYSAGGDLLWRRQTMDRESAVAVAINSSGVFVVGATTSAIPGQPSFGNSDAYIRKFDSNGTEQWVRVLGSSQYDLAYGVAADDSGAYITGFIGPGGSLFGQPALASGDGFVSKYDNSGNMQWSDQFGTQNTDYAYAVTSGPTGVYVVGSTQGLLGIQTLPTFDFDAYVRKYDTSGKLQWTRQFGTIDREEAFAVTSDTTGVYVAGYTRAILGSASLGGEDAFVRKFDPNGNALWTIQTGSVDDDYAYGVTLDAGNIYIGGYTDRNTIPDNVRSGDPFLLKYTQPSASAPNVLDGGVVNNASFAPNPSPVAPGSIAAVFGMGLNDGSQQLTSSFGSNGRLVTSLAGTNVTLNNIPAPIFYSTSGQLGIQIPVELTGQTTASMQVTVAGQVSQTRTVRISPSAPGLFTTSQDGRGTALALHSDGITVVSAAAPAKPNEAIILFGTGFGPLTPSLATGEPSSGNKTVNTPAVTIDGLSAQVLFSGAAPGFVGFNQLNIVIPGLARTSQTSPVALTIGGVPANATTLPIAP